MLEFGWVGEELLGRDFFVAFGDAEDEAVVGPHRFDFKPAFGAKFCADGHAPRRVNAAAKWSEDADAAIAEFVAAGFDHDVLIVGDARGGDGLIFEIAQKIFGGVGVEAVIRDQRAECDGARLSEQFARHGADFLAEFGGAAGGVAMPERHFAGFAGRGRNENAIVRDFVDAPGGGAEDDGVAGAAFEHHFFVEFADAGAFCGAGEKNAIEAAIGNRAAVDDGDAAGALARRQAIRNTVPGDARAEFGEFVAGIAAGEHVEHGFENGAREIGVGRGGADELEEIVDVPLVE